VTVQLTRLPLFDALADADTILLAGAGGGYDVYGGLPLYFALRGMGKTVHLANLSFSTIYASTGKRIGGSLVRITDRDEITTRYFPEWHLAHWFRERRGEDVPVYCIERTGARPVAAAYRNLVDHLGGVDAIVLVDGGTDSLLRGDEPDLGTPQEDVASLAAVESLIGVKHRYLACIGFGVDVFHGVSHYYFLEAVADLARQGAYLGAFSVLAGMPEAQAYLDAVGYVHERMFNHPSIVNSSIASAVEGHFGNHQRVFRTENSELFINPLMALYFCFDLPAVANRNLYLNEIRGTEDYFALSGAISAFLARTADARRPWRDLPV
jgi:hypothetical protein